MRFIRPDTMVVVTGQKCGPKLASAQEYIPTSLCGTVCISEEIPNDQYAPTIAVVYS